MSQIDNSIYLRTFNEQLSSFMDELERVLPQNITVSNVKMCVEALKKTNPKLIILGWQKYVVIPYIEKINEGDYNFFIEKDYSSDLNGYKNSESVLKSINDMRESVRDMDENNKKTSFEFISNLCNLSKAYNGLQ